MQNRYGVSLIPDEALPEEQDWAFVEVRGETYFLVKASKAASPRVLAEAWAGYRHLIRCRKRDATDAVQLGDVSAELANDDVARNDLPDHPPA